MTSEPLEGFSVSDDAFLITGTFMCEHSTVTLALTPSVCGVPPQTNVNIKMQSPKCNRKFHLEVLQFAPWLLHFEFGATIAPHVMGHRRFGQSWGRIYADAAQYRQDCTRNLCKTTWFECVERRQKVQFAHHGRIGGQTHAR